MESQRVAYANGESISCPVGVKLPYPPCDNSGSSSLNAANRVGVSASGTDGSGSYELAAFRHGSIAELWTRCSTTTAENEIGRAKNALGGQHETSPSQVPAS